ncbi:MAG TPA: lysophospholipid acyltransferase family protein [Chthoniobacterales bacterium]
MNFWYFTVYHLTRLIAKLCFRFRCIHPERVIQEGPVILAMNHQSYLDPPLAGIGCRRAIYFLARKTLFDQPFLGWILPRLNVIPIDQERSDVSALKATIRVLRQNDGVLVFPEGSRTLDGQLQAPEAGVGFVIAKTLAPVVPMRIFGAHEALPRGGGKLRFCPITIVVGEPLRFTAADLQGNNRDVYSRLSRRVMEAIAALQLEPDAHRP